MIPLFLSALKRAFGRSLEIGILCVGSVLVAAPAEIGWRPIASGTTEALNGIVEGQLLVIVGSHGTILTSGDGGATWIQRMSGVTEDLASVTFDSGRYIAVGGGGVILESRDAVTWTRVPSPTRLRLNSVDRSFAVGDAGVGLLTRDATGTWQRSDPGFANRRMLQISGAVAVGEQGAMYRLNDTWTDWVAVPTNTTEDLYAYAASVAVGQDGYGVGGTQETMRALAPRIGTDFSIVTLTQHSFAGELFAVGTHGAVFRRAYDSDGWGQAVAGWVEDPTPTKQTLNAALAVPSGMLVVGDGGMILLHPLTPPAITSTPVVGYDATGVPYVEGSAAGEGAWSYRWLQFSGGAPYPVGAGYPRQSLATAPLPLPGIGFRLVAGNAFGSAVADVAANRLLNVSARAKVGTGEDALIVGFSASGTNRLLIRGVGPGLAAFGVLEPLRRPRLRLFQGATELPLTTVADVATQAKAFPIGPQDVAYLVQLPARGNYTVQLDSATGESGVGLLEIYDLDAGILNRLTNLSARANVGAGEDLLIGGFVVEGGLGRNHLIRGIGPGLAAFGVQSPLTRPRVAVYAGATVWATAGAWTNESNAESIRNTAQQIGAFALSNADAALLLPLTGGTYTADLSSVDGKPGVALVEIYQAP